jgi:hypothetical protein
MGMIAFIQLRDQARRTRQAEEEVRKALSEADAMLRNSRTPQQEEARAKAWTEAEAALIKAEALLRETPDPVKERDVHPDRKK